MNLFHTPRILPALLFLFPISVGLAENIVFPDSAEVIDVTKPPYGAIGDGTTDATAAIQQALDSDPAGNRIIYLPNGTYLVSKQLRWPPSTQTDSKSGKSHKRTILQGQSRDGAIIQLSDNNPDFQTPMTDRKGVPIGNGVIWTGLSPAQRFRNSIRNLTVNTGSGNPAANGIQFNTSNQGTVRQVRIISGDGGGLRGLDLAYTGEIGPALFQDIEISGFDYGIYTDALNSITVERLSLEKQRLAGIYNRGQNISLNGLVSNNTVPAIQSMKKPACVVLLNAELKGGDPSNAAITNEGVLYVRNLTVAGYGVAIENIGDASAPAPEGQSIAEYCSHEPLRQFSTEGLSLKLPIKEPPVIEWETDFSKWVSPLDHGADGTGKRDDTAAIQAAIDTPGKTVLYFPGGKSFRIEGDLIVRGSISRIIGCEGKLAGPGREKGTGRIIFEDGEAPAVILERIDAMYSGVTLVHDTSRSVTLSSCAGFNETVSEGTGDLFIEDLTGSVKLMKPGQNVWMRQINPEGREGNDIDNEGATVWILGLKTERDTTKVRAAGGGKTEVLGAHIYSTDPGPMPNPLMVIEDATASFAGIRETKFGKNTPYEIYVSETQNGQTRELRREDVPNKRFLPLYVGGDPE